MGFLKRMLRSTGPEGLVRPNTENSFEQLSDEELQAHMGINRYGVFDLSDAVRPSYDLQIVPKQGFRHDEYHDETTGEKIPVVMASATRGILVDLFLELIDELGPVVDVVLESSHQGGAGHQDFYREHIDLPVLKSVLVEFEDLLLHDGCCGVAVVNPRKRQEIQFDEHKLLIAYGQPLDPFEQLMIASDVYPSPDIQFITEAEHVHSSSERFVREFDILKSRLGMDQDY
jgi:hypothetical protein